MPKSRSNSQGNRQKIALLDDHPILLHGTTLLLKEEPDLTICWEGVNASEAWDAIERENPDLVIMDIALRGTDGLDYIKNLHAVRPSLPIFVFTMYEETLYAERTIRAGAKAYLMKNCPIEELVTAVRQVLKGEIYLSKRMRDRMINSALTGRRTIESSPIERLTDRELEVFRHIGEGCGTRRIAEKLRLSVKTIETYRAHIMEKLNLQKSTELVLHAFQWVNHDLNYSTKTSQSNRAD